MDPAYHSQDRVHEPAGRDWQQRPTEDVHVRNGHGLGAGVWMEGENAFAFLFGAFLGMGLCVTGGYEYGIVRNVDTGPEMQRERHRAG